MSEAKAKKYKDIDWQTELDQFFSMPKPCMTVFSKDKPYTYWNLQSRVRNDPRYPLIKRAGHTELERIELYPVIIEPESHVIHINGFDLEIDDHTDKNALRIVLEAMRSI